MDRAVALEKARAVLNEIKDPEIPVLSIADLGMVDNLEVDDQGVVHLNLLPTFVGCPAIEWMKSKVKKRLLEEGLVAEVKVDYAQAWSSNRITEEGIQQLKAFGLATPKKHSGDVELSDLENVPCPHCGSEHTSLNSPFGSTLCRALHFCYDCRQGFEQFKPV